MAHYLNFELVSFDICPYVQRSVITLKHKKVDFKITYIDLEETPAWFNKISPLGKVPLLLVRSSENKEPIVLFESAVINEYIDEVTPPSVAPKDPLKKAQARGWIEVGSELLMSLYTVMVSKEKEEANEATNEIWDLLSHVERQLPGGNWFSPQGFSLVDAAFAPVFMRMFMVKSLKDDSHWKSLPKTHTWAKALLALPEVRDSVIPEFKDRYRALLKKQDAPVADQIV